MATTMRVVVSVEDEGAVKCLQVNMVLDERLTEVEQRLKMRKMLNLVRHSMLSSLKTAVAHDVLGWKRTDVGDALRVMEPEDRPNLGHMVRLRYPGYDAEPREESAACGMEEPK
jgi:hypothetical protein